MCGLGGTLAEATFDRILMNPPFGEKVDARLAEKVLGHKVGSRSETALTALALDKLATEGRAAILVPSGLLFSNSAGERELRKRLVDEYALEAIVSFPKDAFQPFSTLLSHLLLVRKATPTEQSRVWFLQVEYDGYPAGRGRDLTMPPTGPTDLPFVESVLLSRSANFDTTFPQGRESILGIKKIESDEGPQLGVVVEATEHSVLSAASLFPGIESTRQFILIDGTGPSKNLHLCIQIFPDTGEASEVENREVFLRELYKPRKSDPAPPGTLLFRSEVSGQATAISADGRLFGVTVPPRWLKFQMSLVRLSISWNAWV